MTSTDGAILSANTSPVITVKGKEACFIFHSEDNTLEWS